jgi:hypothetical protein
VAEPPCITSSGEVFTRVSGESIPVRDPVTLRRLYEQGQGRAAAADFEAVRAAGATYTSMSEELSRPFLRIRIGVASIGRADEIRANVFSESFPAMVLDAIKAPGSWPGG